jgi:hypothetical protein
MTPNANWLKAAHATNDLARCLIKGIRLDLKRNPAAFPPLFPNIQTLRAYLYDRDICPEAMPALPVVWRRYRVWLEAEAGSITILACGGFEGFDGYRSMHF